MRRLFTAAMLALAAVAAPAAVEAQTAISARSSSLRIGGRLHGQYQGSSVDGAVNDFFIRRARVIVDGTFSDFLVGRVQADFAPGATALQDAYVRMNLDPAFRISVGQFKRAFDLFELSSSTDLAIVERSGKIRGYSTCNGVGSVCSFSRLTESLGFAGRDVGIKIDGSSGTISYQATFTNGTGIGVPR